MQNGKENNIGHGQREIKFRGMLLNGKRVYGLLCKPTVGKYAGHTFISNRGGMPMAMDVRPETVGQFIGLYDRNGNEIYEGDLLKYKGNNLVREVDMIKCSWCIVHGSSIYKLYEYGLEYTIVGNIYENKELIGTVG